jgi:hypothetical protein
MDPFTIRLGLNSFEVRENRFIPAGSVASMGLVVFTRHLSEFITAVVAGATVHYERTTCPTWDDSVECRCMMEGR